MNAPRPDGTTAAFEIKGSSFTMIVLELATAEPAAIEAQLAALLARTPNFFDHDPVVLDLKGLGDSEATPDFRQLSGILRRHQLVPVGVSNGSPAQRQAALAVGLGLFEGIPAEIPRTPGNAASPAPPPVAAAPPAAPVEPAGFTPARLITRPVRTGQQIYARGTDLVVLAPVSAGAEVLADGNIHIYAPLRGRALAGVRGNTAARIFSRSMEAELVSIAGCYRMVDSALLADFGGQPVQIYLNGERLVIEALP